MDIAFARLMHPPNGRIIRPSFLHYRHIFAMSEYFLIVIGTVFVNNIVMVKILGLCPFMGVSKKLETSLSMGAATTFVLTIASGSSYLVNHYLLGPDLAYLTTLSFIVVIAAIVQFTEMVIKKTSPVLYQVLGIYLPLITTNCAVLGIAILLVEGRMTFIGATLFAFASSIGYSLVMVIFAGLRDRLALADVPRLFAGSPIGFIVAGLLALAFMGFSGMSTT